MTSVERLVTNGQRILQVLKDFSFNSSGDVSIDYIINNDGDEETYTMWSVRKIMDNLYGVIYDYMTKKVYVDPDGDDTNDGSIDNPVATIGKAISIIGESSRSIVYLENDKDHKILESGTYGASNIYAKNLRIYPKHAIDDDNPSPKIKINNYDDSSYPDNTTLEHRFILQYGGSVIFNYIDFILPETINSDRPFSTWLFQSCPIMCDGGSYVTLHNCNVDMSGDRESLCILGQSRYSSQPNLTIYGGEYVCGDSNRLINNRSSSPVTAYIGTTIKNADGDTLDTEDYCVLNVKRDADSGNPININSNLNLSD